MCNLCKHSFLYKTNPSLSISAEYYCETQYMWFVRNREAAKTSIFNSTFPAPRDDLHVMAHMVLCKFERLHHQHLSTAGVHEASHLGWYSAEVRLREQTYTQFVLSIAKRCE